MKRLLSASLAIVPASVFAADAITGAVQNRPPTTKRSSCSWSSWRPRSALLTGRPNAPLAQRLLPAATSPVSRMAAMAGDFMSAASFLGISALVYTSGYDGLIYSLGFLVGWPMILFLIAERLRNRSLYLCRCGVLSPAAKAYPHPFRLRFAGGGGAVSDCADGGCR